MKHSGSGFLDTKQQVQELNGIDQSMEDMIDEAKN